MGCSPPLLGLVVTLFGGVLGDPKTHLKPQLTVHRTTTQSSCGGPEKLRLDGWSKKAANIPAQAEILYMPEKRRRGGEDGQERGVMRARAAAEELWHDDRQPNRIIPLLTPSVRWRWRVIPPIVSPARHAAWAAVAADVVPSVIQKQEGFPSKIGLIPRASWLRVYALLCLWCVCAGLKTSHCKTVSVNLALEDGPDDPGRPFVPRPQKQRVATPQVGTPGRAGHFAARKTAGHIVSPPRSATASYSSLHQHLMSVESTRNAEDDFGTAPVHPGLFAKSWKLNLIRNPLELQSVPLVQAVSHSSMPQTS
ncbi:uncharacterized protein P884DRAFT_270206 [Thermothelomyces heterothallicus CBS 202.75]|uniref:uncharacterized protein n=1 Tax=Thermothelomyces heterothallicus CBS 202.75 TaxID=1149848 RepID=UPI0037437247